MKKILVGVRNIENMLTFDVGQSSVKTALHKGSHIEMLEGRRTDYDTLQEAITTVVRSSRVSDVGFATSVFCDDTAQEAWDFKEGHWVSVFDYSQLEKDTGCTVHWVGNDAEATALAINDSATNIEYWQQETLQRNNPRGVLYLGTGFQFCPVDSSGRAAYNINFLMPLGGGILDGSLERKLKEITRRDSGQLHLRVKDVCSGVGIENLHEALTGERRSGEAISSLEHSETYQIFSRVLGRVLSQIFVTGSYRGGLIVGGTLAVKLAPMIHPEQVIEGFSAQDSDFVRSVKTSVPLGIMTESCATHRGIAYAIRNRIDSTYTGIVKLK